MTWYIISVNTFEEQRNKLLRERTSMLAAFNFDIVLHIAAVVITFASILYMMKRETFFEQKLMLMVFICIFVYNIGTLLQLTSKNIYEAKMAMKVSNFGYSFLGILLVFFVVRYLGHKINNILFFSLLGEGLTIALLTTVFLDSNLVYRVYGFLYSSRGTPLLLYDYGVIFAIDGVLSVAMLVYGLTLIVIALAKCKESFERKRISALFNMVVIVAVSYVVNDFMLPADINIMPIILAIISIMLVVTIEKYNLIDVVASARDRVFETMPDAVFALDEDMNIRDINAAGIKLFPEIADCKGQPIPEKYSFLFTNPDDKLNFKHNGVHFERHFSPVFFKGILKGYSIILIDVTYTHQMMLQMRELKKRADAASESKSDFLANMSHEIRTPMNAIVGYTDLICKEPLTAEGKDYAESIRNSSNILLHIINDILDFSKVEQGRLEIVDEEYPTSALFDEVTDIMQISASKKGLRLIVGVDPTTPSVLYGDRMRIRQVLMNIVGNAIKFTNEGSVRMMTEWQPEDPDRAILTITISDTGIGIDREDINRLFEEFEQAEKKTPYAKPGTGLGLTISKALLEMMGGSIRIESEKGVGTSVVISIKQKIVNNTPIAATSTVSSKEETQTKDVMVAPDAKILVVDDNRVNLELMNNYLKQYRIIPVLSESGAEAVKLAGENYYDIIFMDQMMPEMDGVEAMKRIRALGGRNAKELPIIALTANAIAGTRNALIGEGFTDYASKPLPIKTLEYLLTKYLPKGTYTLSAELSEAGALGNVTKNIVGRAKVLDLPDYINQKIGLANAGDDLEQYRSVVSIVYKYADEKITKIKELLGAEDYPAYTIEVHALKSNAATVGAMKLADKARALETAGKQNDIATIRRDSAEFLDEYERFARDLGRYLEGGNAAAEDAEDVQPQGDAMSANDEEYLQTFEEIGAAVMKNNYDDAKDLFGVLEFFELPPVINHAVSCMKEAADRSDWQYVLDILTKMK